MNPDLLQVWCWFKNESEFTTNRYVNLQRWKVHTGWTPNIGFIWHKSPVWSLSTIDFENIILMRNTTKVHDLEQCLIFICDLIVIRACNPWNPSPRNVFKLLKISEGEIVLISQSNWIESKLSGSSGISSEKENTHGIPHGDHKYRVVKVRSSQDRANSS